MLLGDRGGVVLHVFVGLRKQTIVAFLAGAECHQGV
jgi:hypothetical protein